MKQENPLNYKEIQEFLRELNNSWRVNELGQLNKYYEFANFKEAMEFANQIALIAEREGHHPDLVIGWGKCEVRIWTHKINGLTENDFILATKIEGVKNKAKKVSCIRKSDL